MRLSGPLLRAKVAEGTEWWSSNVCGANMWWSTSHWCISAPCVFSSQGWWSPTAWDVKDPTLPVASTSMIRGQDRYEGGINIEVSFHQDWAASSSAQGTWPTIKRRCNPSISKRTIKRRADWCRTRRCEVQTTRCPSWTGIFLATHNWTPQWPERSAEAYKTWKCSAAWCPCSLERVSCTTTTWMPSWWKEFIRAWADTKPPVACCVV